MNQEEQLYYTQLIRELMDQGFKARQVPRLLSMRIWYEEHTKNFRIANRIHFLHWLVEHGHIGGARDGATT